MSIDFLNECTKAGDGGSNDTSGVDYDLLRTLDNDTNDAADMF